VFFLHAMFRRSERNKDEKPTTTLSDVEESEQIGGDKGVEVLDSEVEERLSDVERSLLPMSWAAPIRR
jgi:hypothetical protein